MSVIKPLGQLSHSSIGLNDLNASREIEELMFDEANKYHLESFGPLVAFLRSDE